MMKWTLLWSTACPFLIALFLTFSICPMVLALEAIGGSGDRALFFDGINDIAKVSVGGDLKCSGNNLFQLEDFTVEWWYYRMDDNTKDGNILVSGDLSGIDISEQGSIGMKWGIESESSGKCHASYYEYLPTDQAARWVHLAVTYRKDADGTTRKVVHANGLPLKLSGGDSTELECEAYSVTTSPSLFMGGGFQNKTAVAVSHPNKFMIDEMRIWKMALSPTQILERMHRVLTPDEIASPYLLLYWDFDLSKKHHPHYEDVSIIRDRSPNGLDLKLGTPFAHASGPPYLKERLPERVPSTAPVTGSALRINVPVFKPSVINLSGWDPVKKAIVTTSNAAHGATAELVSIPPTSTGVLSAVVAGEEAPITTVPFHLASGAELKFTPEPKAEGSMAFFKYTLTVDGAEASVEQEVKIKILVNRPPIAGDGGRAVLFEGSKHTFGFIPLDWPMTSKGTVRWNVGGKDKQKTWVMGGAMTIEFWLHVTEENYRESNGKIFYMDSGFGNECGLYHTPRHGCNGQMEARIKGGTGQIAMVYGAGKYGGTLAVNTRSNFGSWMHIAMSACGMDPTCRGEPRSMYVNGELISQSAQPTSNWGLLRGLTIGGRAIEYFSGSMDELRIWSSFRTAKQIRDHMYSSLKGGGVVHRGLEVAYSFNDADEKEGEIAIKAHDNSGNGRKLTWGGCSMTTFRGKMQDLCARQQRQDLVVDDVFLPGRPRSVGGAPVGGNFDPIDITAVHDSNLATSGTVVALLGRDPDGDEVSFHITALPERGMVLTSAGNAVVVGQALPSSSVTYVPAPYGGGENYASFSYEVRDAVLVSDPLSVAFNIVCMEGAELNPASHVCAPCPEGTFNPERDSTCRSCPALSTTTATEQTGCVCGVGFEWEQDSLSCLQVGVPCTETGCSENAECAPSGACDCISGYEPVPGMEMDEMNPHLLECRLSMATTPNKRVLFSVSGYVSVVSFVSLLVAIFQFAVNKATQNVWIRSYLAILIPDIVLNFLYLPYYIWNTLKATDVGSDICETLGLLTSVTVIATLLGPVVVSYVAYRQVSWSRAKRSSSGKSPGSALSVETVSALVGVPWTVGSVLTALIVMQDDNLLGSYRGLVCHTTRMDDPTTGGVLLLLFTLSLSATLFFYAQTKGEQNRVMRRGIRLVVMMFLTWAVFMVCTALGLIRTPAPMWLEVAGFIPIAVKPFLDAYSIMSMQTVWDGVLTREVTKHERRKGLSSANSQENTKKNNDISTATGTGTGSPNGDGKGTSSSSVAPSSMMGSSMDTREDGGGTKENATQEAAPVKKF